jgi:hypothetical protein
MIPLEIKSPPPFENYLGSYSHFNPLLLVPLNETIKRRIENAGIAFLNI